MRSNQELVEYLVRTGVLKTKAIIEAFEKVDRGIFVPREYKSEAYSDIPLPTKAGQTISQPSIVAMMTEALKPCKNNVVLEVGTGSGYQAAILAHVCKFVYTIERIRELYEFAGKNLKKAGIKNVKIILGDGSKGIPGKKFDRIIITAAAPEIPAPLLQQLKKPGILVAPVGTKYMQKLVRVEKKENGSLKYETLESVVFVPLVGEFGFKEEA